MKTNNLEKNYEDSLQAILNYAGKIPLLTPEEEEKLGKKGHKKSDEDVDKLFLHNLRLAIKISLQVYDRYPRGMTKNLDLTDVIYYGFFGPDGTRGLQKAALLYDSNRKTKEGKPVKFSTYASQWIRSSVVRSLKNYGRTIRIPVYLEQILSKISKYEATKVGANFEIPEEKICSDLNLSESSYKKAIHADKLIVITSLDEIISTGEGEFSISDVIEDPNAINPREKSENHEASYALENLLQVLSQRNQRVLRYHFGLSDGEHKTFVVTGKKFGITKQRANQIVNDSISKMRKYAILRNYI